MKITTKEQFEWLIHDMGLPNAQARCRLDNIEIDFVAFSDYHGAPSRELENNIQTFCNALKNYPATHIVLANQTTWTDRIFCTVLGALAYNQTVTHVNLANNPAIGPYCMHQIDALVARDQIKAIDLSGCTNPDYPAYFRGSRYVSKFKGLDAAPSSSASSTSTTTTSSGSASPSAPAASAEKFYGVSDEKESEYFGSVLIDTAYKAFAKSTRFKVFNDRRQASNYQKDQKTSGWFGGELLPIIYLLVIKNGVQVPNEGFAEKAHIAAAHYRADQYVYHHRPDSDAHLFYSDEQEKILRSIIYTAVAKCRRAIETTTTSSESAADTGGMCSTMSSSDARSSGASRHSLKGVTRAEEFYDSLFNLDFYGLMAAITKYINRPLAGNYDRGKSFKAILYVELLKHYGESSAQEYDSRHTPEIKKEDLINILEKAKNAIQAQALAEVNAAQLPRMSA